MSTLTSETIRIARIALFDRGNMVLKIEGKKGRMVGTTPVGCHEASAYNELAALSV